MYGFIFACCFAGIPVYRVFCEHVGLVGNYDKKTYEFKDQKGIFSIMLVVNLKKYIIKF
jgi:cytochrome c oxidase assembly protein Cox11